MLRAWWGLVIGGIGGTIGFILDAVPTVSISTSVWIIIAIIAVVVAQFHTFHWVRCERDSYIPHKSKADTPIFYLFKYLDRESIYDDHGNAGNLLQEANQKAANGDIIIWGRPVPISFTVHSPPLEPIEKEYWREYTFNARSVLFPSENLRGEEHTHRIMYSPRPERVYHDLHYNAMQAKRIWPQKNRLILLFEKCTGKHKGKIGGPR